VIRCRCGPAGHISGRRPKSTTASSNPGSEYVCDHVLMPRPPLQLDPRPPLLRCACGVHADIGALRSAGWMCSSAATGARRHTDPPLVAVDHGERRDPTGQRASLLPAALLAACYCCSACFADDERSRRHALSCVPVPSQPPFQHLCPAMATRIPTRTPPLLLSPRSARAPATGSPATRQQHAARLPFTPIHCASVYPSR
jgi:hypothetical protein